MRFLFFLPLAFLVLCADSASRAAVPERPRFNRDIRPILSNNCFYCHGPDEKKREAKLRLDLRENALAEHDSGRAIMPGKPDESELLTRILSHDKEEVMPPPKAKKTPLTMEQVATLRRWIEQGAEYEGPWAFLPLSTLPPPSVRDRAWVRNPVDQFILARLESEGIKPSPEADRATLIRRVSLDLLGLLPTLEEVAAFVADPAPDAYEKLVDRLLANPHYGERWGRHWLDQARYADSNGYSIDAERQQWPFRDWVIKALNDDMPFDRFTVEQLAGDLLPNPTKSQLIATAFHRNTLINQEGGVKPEQFRFEEIVDRVNTTGAVWLGLTIGCAQCHSHKFDPISQREFYQTLAFFNQSEDANSVGPTVRVVRGEIFGKPVEPLSQPQPAEKASAPVLSQEDWEKIALARLSKASRSTVAWSPAEYVEYGTESGAALQRLDDNSLLADSRVSANDTYRVVVKTSLKKIAAVRLRVLTHESLPHGGPGLAPNGNFVLTQFEAHVGAEERAFSEAFADHEQSSYGVSGAIDDNAETGWGIEAAKNSPAKTNANHEAVFVFAKPLEPGAQTIEFKLHHGSSEHHLVGRFALEFSETAPPNPNAPLLAALRTAPEVRDDDLKKLLHDRYVAETKPAASKAQKKSGDPNVADLMVMREAAKPRETFIQIRGDYLRPDEKTGPLLPGVIAAANTAFRNPESEFRTRLDLARWLVSPENPLTPRVTMNRVWMRFFGRGIVETEEDFGAQGSGPTNPELLDWLAREFIRQGWSMKKMQRLILTSATYRQTSKARPDLAEKDPRNLLLARQERVRVEAEIVRDAALSASGLLNPEIGGPSVHPPQPDGVYSFTQTNKKWQADQGPDRYRRAMYTMFYRSSPYPLLTTFDTPEMQATCTRRARSNTPLQALNVANDPAFLELAQGLAFRVLHETQGDDEARLRRAFLLTLCREPSAKEFGLLRDYFQSVERDMLGVTYVPNDALARISTPALSTAALVQVARVLFNTDNFITRE
jgi:hypothetical protein